jgi:cytochrome c553
VKYTKTIFIMVALVLSVQGNVAQAGDAAKGKDKTATCAACHGATGISAIPANPNLAGQKEQYLIKSMNDYKSGKRDDATMKAMVGALSDDDIKNVAAFYATQACK